MPGQPADLGREHHADRDRVAVPEPVALEPLDRVAERMPVVEHLPLPRLAQVGGDHRAFTRIARSMSSRVCGPYGSAAPAGSSRDQPQDLPSAMNPALITSASPAT